MASTDRDVLVALCHSICNAGCLLYNWSIDLELTKWRKVYVNSEGRVTKLHVGRFGLLGRARSAFVTANLCLLFVKRSAPHHP